MLRGTCAFSSHIEQNERMLANHKESSHSLQSFFKLAESDIFIFEIMGNSFTNYSRTVS